MNRERQRWTNLASRNPYWAVVSWPEFHENDLDEDAIRRFFESGERHVASVLATVRAHVDPDFEPGRALEYGCGVGRIAIPLARVCEHVVAVDISEAMLNETEANCASGSDVVSVNRFESTNSSRSVCPEPISWIIFGSATVAAMQALARHQVYGARWGCPWSTVSLTGFCRYMPTGENICSRALPSPSRSMISRRTAV